MTLRSRTTRRLATTAALGTSLIIGFPSAASSSEEAAAELLSPSQTLGEKVTTPRDPVIVRPLIADDDRAGVALSDRLIVRTDEAERSAAQRRVRSADTLDLEWRF